MTLDGATLLALMGALIASQTVVVKWLMNRSDKLLEHLAKAVEAFQNFEKSEDKIHERIISGLSELAKTQERILALLEKLNTAGQKSSNPT